MTDVLPIVWPRTGQIQFATTDSLPFWMGVGWRVLDLDGDGNPDSIGGGSSGASAAVQHIQVTPMATWTIPHGLGRIPCVQIYDILGRQVDTDVEATIPQVVITFPAPAVGVAVLT